jgi:hypothetical protein
MSTVPESISEGIKSDFDFLYYANNNADIATAFGSDDQDSLWEHFVNFGRFENRIHRFVPAIVISGTESNGNTLVFNSTLNVWEPSSIVATSLTTTGDSLVISSASAPSTDQILTATSATEANWQTDTKIYGTDFRSNSESSTISTTTTDFSAEALAISNTVVDGGTYKITWHAQWTIEDASYNGEVRISMTGDSSTILGLESFQVFNTGDTKVTDGFRFITLTGGGSYGVTMEYRVNAPGTINMTRRRLEIYRVE